MSFLDRAKQTANKAINNNDNKGGSPMGNPFIKQNITNNTVNSKPAINVPGAKPAVAPTTKPAVPGAIKPPVGIKPPAGVGTKPPVAPSAKPPVAPAAKPIAPAPVKPEVEEVKEEMTPQEPVVAQEPQTPEIPETKVDEVQDVKVEETKEEVKEEKVKQETKNDTEEYTEEELAAMSPQKRAAITRKKNQEAKKKAETKENAKTAIKEHKEESAKASTEPVVIPSTDLSFADCITAIKSNFVDQEWEDFRSRITTTMSEIVISNEMNKPQLHDLLSQIAILRDEISIVYNDIKTLYEGLTAKDDGLIDRTKRLNAKGTNAEERKVSGTIAVMNYKSKEGHNINLFELLDETRARYNFLKTINESIEFKKAVLLTMLSSLKSEK